MSTLTRLRTVLALMAGSVVLSGCDFDVYSLPLPGGTDTGDEPMQVTVQFADVLDLVPKSSVKVNDVSVGQVTEVELDGQLAEVTLELRGDTELPVNAEATIRQTSLLGEKFVSLEAPETGASDELLTDGDTIPIEQSGSNPEVEEVLGALSLILNGGGVAQMKTIASELNLALEGREDSARSVLQQFELLMGQLDAGRADIVDAIDSLNALALEVQRQQPTIDAALEELPSALRSLDRQRDDLVRMLGALNELGDVGTRVVRESKAATIETFRQLQPVLTELANAGDAFVNAFHVFLTYPFVDEVVGRDPQVARNLHMGDYTNLSVQLELDFSQEGGPIIPGPPTELCTPFHELNSLTDLPEDLCKGALLKVTECLNDLKDGDADQAKCRRLVDGTVKDVVAEACEQGLGDLVRGLCPRDGRGGGGGGGGDGPLDDLPVGGLLGAESRRAPVGAVGPVGPDSGADGRGPTFGQLMQLFDPGLVAVLVPGMVVR